MPDNSTQTRADIAATEAELEGIIAQSSPKLVAEYRINRAGGKGVADSFEAAQKSTGISLKTQADQQAAAAAVEYLRVLYRSIVNKDSKQAKFIKKVLTSTDKSAGDMTKALGQMSGEAINLVAKVRKVSDGYRNNIRVASANAQIGIYKFGDSVIGALSGASLFPDEVSKPISSALGSSVNTATAIVRNPLGAPFIIANSMVAIVDKISPGFANKLDSEFKSVNLKNLENLPSKMMGSVKHLAFALDALLSVPFEIMSDLYNGLLDIMEALADIIDGIVSAAIQLILNNTIYAILDSVLLEEIMTFLNEVGELASFVGDIASLAGGFNVITDITSQVTSYSDSFSNALSNPLQLASSYFPQIQQGLGFVDEITGTLRDPEKLLDQYLPPQIGEQIKKISQLPGLGFIGDKGYSVGGILDTLSEGVFTKAIDQFANKSPMLNKLFNKQDVPTENEFAQETHEDGYAVSEYTGGTVHQGGGPAVAQTKKILPEININNQSPMLEQTVQEEALQQLLQKELQKGQERDASKGILTLSRETEDALKASSSNPPTIKTDVVAQGTVGDQTVTITAPVGSPFIPNR